jgi:hypothetical protein
VGPSINEIGAFALLDDRHPERWDSSNKSALQLCMVDRCPAGYIHYETYSMSRVWVFS